MAIHVEAPSVEDENEALGLMVYHLKMAAHYFEATPLAIDLGEHDHFSQPAMDAWLAEMEKSYPLD